MRHLDYRQQIARQYLNLNLPEDFFNNDTAESAYFIEKLIRANIDKIPIYSVGFQPPIDGYTWVPVGMLNKLEKNGFTSEVVLDLNKEVFARFSLNDFGANFGYTHFIPEHIKGLYYLSLISVGNELMYRGFFEDARVYFVDASMLISDKTGAFVGLGDVSVKLNDCISAKAAYFRAYQVNPNRVEVLESIARYFLDCEHNEKESAVYKDKADFEKRKNESTFR